MGNSFGNRLVGRPIDQSSIPPPSANTQAATDRALQELDTQTSRLEKRVNHFETLLKHTQKQVEEAAQRGNKNAAIRLLTRVKEYEASLVSHQAMVQRLVQQRDLLEKSKFQSDTLRVMDHVNQHLKQQSGAITIEKVETIVDDINDLKQNADEIMNILAAPIHDSVSQYELEQEYQTLVAQTAQPILLPKPPMPPTSLPVLAVPPTGFPVAVQSKPSMLEELEAV